MIYASTDCNINESMRQLMTTKQHYLHWTDVVWGVFAISEVIGETPTIYGHLANIFPVSRRSLYYVFPT